MKRKSMLSTDKKVSGLKWANILGNMLLLEGGGVKLG